MTSSTDQLSTIAPAVLFNTLILTTHYIYTHSETMHHCRLALTASTQLLF